MKVKGNRIEKTLRMLLAVLVIANVFFSANSFAKERSVFPSKEQFLQMVRSDFNYVKYKKQLLNVEPKLVNDLRDENNKPYGYIAQFEFEYGNEAKNTIQFASLLAFAYDENKQEVETFIIDYSNSYPDGKIYVRDHTESILHSYAINENLKKYFSDITKEAQVLQELNSDSDNILSNTYCWQCTKYEDRGDNYDGKCGALVGTACLFADKIPIYGKLICAGATIIGCYVPPYKICVEGRWNSRCPVED
ncbi:hypothetical protein [Paenibacillus apiarius]|uniref:hypothetical protein n=1 Tax=Paenibacillus apiarius TaxID=46240 RepID=UPI001F08E914|nr:hypothetical protein [Paenibacillus apiarius]